MPSTSSSPLAVPGRTRLVSPRAWHGAKALAEAILPRSVVLWRGREALEAGARAGRRRVALTFDDGPTDLTRAYLAVLQRYEAHATFFVVGEACASHPELVSAIAAGGHGLAGHGYTHRRFPTLSASELRGELTRTAALLPSSVLRRPLVRPPHGAISPSSLFTCARAGFTTVLWSHDSGDWCTQRSEDILGAFEDEEASKPGAIVLLHDGHAWTLSALPVILSKLKEAGHELVTVGDLLGS